MHPTVDPSHDTQDWVAWLYQRRRQTIDFLLRVILIGGPLALIYVLARAVITQEFSFNTAYYLATYLIVLALYLARRLGDQVRALGVLLVVYGFGVLALYSGWLASSGRVVLLVLIPVSGILIGPRAGFAAAGLVALTYAGFGLAFTRGWLVLRTLPDPTSNTPVFIEGVGFALAIALVLASQWFLAQALRAANEARHQAEQSERVKTHFLATVSHELRTPLNAVINFGQFVASGLYGPVNERQVDALAKSTGSARHLLALINDLLDMSKIEAGRMSLAVEDDVNLQPELEAVASETRALLAGRPVEFVEEIQEGLPTIVGDRRRIRQILLNLTANAAKFTDQGAIRMCARREGDQVLFEVQDTGRGIPEAYHQRIFEPFWQDVRSGCRPEGTGLGLAIARRLAEMHGGRLWLESQEEQGSTFFVSLPICPHNLIPAQEVQDGRSA